MDADQVPTTEQVREVFVLALVPSDGDQTVPEGEFDRWLAAHDRKVQARALEEFADSITPHVCDVIEDGPRSTREYVANTARSHAAALRIPAEEPK